MPAAAYRAIDGPIARLKRQPLHGFIDQDRNVYESGFAVCHRSLPGLCGVRLAGVWLRLHDQTFSAAKSSASSVPFSSCCSTFSFHRSGFHNSTNVFIPAITTSFSIRA